MPLSKHLLLLLTGIVLYSSCFTQRATSFVQLLANAEKETAAQHWPLAITLWQQVNEQNPVHPNYTYQLGNAYLQHGDYSKAIEYFEKGLTLSANKSYYGAFNIAKAYARMGDNNNAMRWLKKSFDLGMPNRSDFKHAAFDGLKTLPAYQEITGTKDVSTLSRIEGWRYDLHFLQEEIERKAFHVVRELTREDLEKEVQRIYAAIPQLTDMQITVEFMKLLVKVGDGHTMLYVMRDKPEVRKYIPVEFFWFKEGLYIVQADKRFEHLLGSKVVSIEGKSPDVMLTALKPILSRDNEQTFQVMSTMKMRQAPVLHAMGLASSTDQLSLQLVDKNGNPLSVTLAADCEIPSRRLWDGLPANWISLEEAIPQKPLYLTNRYTWYWFTYLATKKTVWFQYNQVLNDSKIEWNHYLDSLFRFIDQHEVDKLVIDFRNNNGGNGELSYPLIQHLIKADKINKYGKLFVITGRRTFSAAGICISLLERHTNAIFAGEPAGTSPNFIGEEFEFELPYSHLWGNISDREHHYASAIDYRAWIAPTIYAAPSFEDFIKGRDAAWEGILASYP